MQSTICRVHYSQAVLSYLRLHKIVKPQKVGVFVCPGIVTFPKKGGTGPGGIPTPQLAPGVTGPSVSQQNPGSNPTEGVSITHPAGHRITAYYCVINLLGGAESQSGVLADKPQGLSCHGKGCMLSQRLRTSHGEHQQCHPLWGRQPGLGIG
jgi:hypothetical protein